MVYEREVLEDGAYGHFDLPTPPHLPQQMLHSAFIDDDHRNVHRLLLLHVTCVCMCVSV